MRKVVISDASCFILLQKIDALEILGQTYGTVTTTPDVRSEVKFQLPEWVEVRSPVSSELVVKLVRSIDLGEATAIALASEIVGSIVILDDLKARKVAKELGLEVTGTVGVILKAKNCGIIDKVKPLLAAIHQTNFRLSAETERHVLFLAGELEP